MLTLVLISLILAGATIAGALLVIRGLRGRRVGQTPFCRKCGYNLTALESERCPECGGGLGESSVVVGVRHRRRGLVGTGVALLLLSTVGWVAIGGGVKRWLGRDGWYSKVPAAWVMWQARSTTGLRSQGAYCELGRRVRSGRLSQRQMAKLARQTLSVYPEVTRSGYIAHAAFTVLNRLRMAGALTPEQDAQFFEKIVAVEMKVRPEAVRADGIPVTVTANVFDRWEAGLWVHVYVSPRLPAGKRRSTTQPLGWRIERSERGYSWWSGYYRYTNRRAGHGWGPVPLVHQEHVVWRLRAPAEGSGPQTVECKVTMDFYEGRPDLCDPDNSNLVHTRTMLLEGACNVLAAARAAISERKESLTTAPAELPAGRFPRFVEMSWGTHDGCPDAGLYRGKVHVSRDLLPKGGVFDVTVEAGGERHDAGRILHNPGENCAWVIETGCAPPGIPTVNVVLTPNPAAARETAELTEIWDKPIRQNNIPVSQVLLPEYPFTPRRTPVYLTPTTAP